MDRKSLDPPRRLLETWRNLNRDRKGEPSELLQQMRDVTERGQNFAKQPYMQALAERIWRVVEQPHMRELRWIEASRVTGRLMGRMRPVSPHQPSKRKRKPGGGRKPLHTLERIAEGICVVRSRPKVSIEAACETLREAGFKGSNTVLYELMVKPAYARRS